jgi:hypothetical protein
MSGVTDLAKIALEILESTPQGLPYRELVLQISAQAPGLSREEIAEFVGGLPKSHPQSVWRPKPGHFAIRTQFDQVRRLGRPPKNREQEPPPKTQWPARPLPNRIENLKKLGFTEVGYWLRTSEGLECRYTAEFDAKRALFAYVLSDNVVYIGRQRKPNAAVPIGSGYISRAIRNALAHDKSVRIYALCDWTELEHEGMPINIAAGIEDELIERMQPPWNDYGR